MRVALEGPSYEGKTQGRVPFVDASAIMGEGTLHVFATNRSLEESAEVRVDVAGLAIEGLQNAEILTAPGAKAANSYEQPEVVKPVDFREPDVSKGRGRMKLPPLSFVAASFKVS